MNSFDLFSQEHMEDLKTLSPDEINLLGKPFDTKSIMMYASDVGAKGNVSIEDSFCWLQLVTFLVLSS